MDKRIADTFESVLDTSIKQQMERFGFCQYDPDTKTLVDIMPADYFENHCLIKHTDIYVEPNEVMMKQVKQFNASESGELSFPRNGDKSERTYSFERINGVLVPYHSHPGQDDDFFSSNGGVHGDTAFSFGRFDMLLDLVVSANAREIGLRPPVCATINPRVEPYNESKIPFRNVKVSNRNSLDKSKGIKPGTHSRLLWQQMAEKIHITIDFIVEG